MPCLLYTVGKTFNKSLAGGGETNPPRLFLAGSLLHRLLLEDAWKKKSSVMNADVGICRESVRVDLTWQAFFLISFFPVPVPTLTHIVFLLIR